MVVSKKEYEELLHYSKIVEENKQLKLEIKALRNTKHKGYKKALKKLYKNFTKEQLISIGNNYGITFVDKE